MSSSVSTLRHFLAVLRADMDLSTDETAELFIVLQDEDLDESIIADILTAWRDKGATVDEIYSLVQIMRERARRIESRHPVFIGHRRHRC